jgi:ubiquinone/menaquinone biosynthesis C-methylase UbiE
VIEKLLELILAANRRMNDKSEEINFASNSSILIKLKENRYVKLNFDGSEFTLIENTNGLESFEEYQLSLKLLNRILKEPRDAHWNNAIICPSIKIRRIPNTFEQGL